jgi:hypothetical protein
LLSSVHLPEIGDDWHALMRLCLIRTADSDGFGVTPQRASFLWTILR